LTILPAIDESIIMSNMKKIIFLFSLIAALFVLVLPLRAARAETVYFFYGDGCPHCAKEEVFLDNLTKTRSDVKVNSFEVWHNQGNLALLAEVGKALSADVSGVPLTVVGDKSITGFLSEETTGRQIERYLDQCRIEGCPDVVGGVIQGLRNPVPKEEEANTETAEAADGRSEILNKIDLPIFGEVETKNLSLPVLTVVIGALDGFNPCAMWVLVFLISLLLGMQNRRRMWILGAAFIMASAAVYFIFMAAWLNLLLFLGFLIWIRVIIGLVALGSGGYHLREWWTNRAGYCKVTGSEKRRRIFEKLKRITQNKSFFIALVGIILLAFAVNLVEAICSAGLPAVYTQILALSDLPVLSYYLYILLYVLIFMLDDLIIFIAAMVTLRATGLSGRYSRFSNLIGGLAMLIIGLLLIFKPEWLMFG